MQRAHFGQVREHRTFRARQGAHDFSALAGAGCGDGTAAGWTGSRDADEVASAKGAEVEEAVDGGIELAVARSE